MWLKNGFISSTAAKHNICFNCGKQPWKQNEICLKETYPACLSHGLRTELQRIRFGDSIPIEVDLVRIKDIFTFLVVKNIYVEKELIC